MNRAGWQATAARHLADAQLLLNNSRWANAYYRAGYAVECGLKSCILAEIQNTGSIFDVSDYYKNVRIHTIDELVKIAGLQAQHNQAKQASQAFATNWAVVKDWKPESRYDAKTQIQAQDLHNAITANPDGALIWIQQHW